MAIRFVDIEPGDMSKAKAAAPLRAPADDAEGALPLPKPEPKPRGRKKPLR